MPICRSKSHHDAVNMYSGGYSGGYSSVLKSVRASRMPIFPSSYQDDENMPMCLSKFIYPKRRFGRIDKTFQGREY
jgi:hypothetical protein